MPCRSGCPTQDHASWGECARSSVRFGLWHSAEVQRGNDWDGELAEYRAARSQGIQPKSTRRADIRKAVAVSDKMDRPVDATRDLLT